MAEDIKSCEYKQRQLKEIWAVLPIFLYILFIGLGVVIAFYPTLISRFAFMQTDPGDTRLNNYFLEHSFQLFVNRNYSGGLWSPSFFYPDKNVLAFSENLFGAAPIYWLVRAFYSSDIAFQLWMIAVCILNFLSFAVLMRRYRVSHLLSVLGAFLFAFSMPRVFKLGHQQLLPQFFTPLAFLAMWEFVKQPTRKRLALFLLLTYLQVLAGIYLGWFLLFSLLIFFSITYGLYSEDRTKFLAYWRSDRKAIIAITLGWIALLVITLLPYLEAKSVFGPRPYSEVDSMLPRISSWFAVGPGNLWSSLLGWTSKGLPMAHEHFLFAGGIVVLLTGLSVYTFLRLRHVLTPERAWIVKVCLLVFLVIFCLSLRLPFGLSLWRIVYSVVPGASVIRGVTRIWTIAYFYLFIAIILSFDSLLKAVVIKKGVRIVIVSILCLVCISEQIVLNLPSYEKAIYTKQVEEIREVMSKGCDIAYVLVAKSGAPFYIDHLSAMWAGIEANVPVVNGYSGNVPRNYSNILESLNTAQVIYWLEPATKKTTKRLCMISPKLGEPSKLVEKPDSLISTYAVQEATSSSGSWISHSLKIPLAKNFSQDIKSFEIPTIVKLNSGLKLPVMVKNTSNFLWSPKGKHPTHFSYRWLDSNGKLAVFEGDGDRTPLPYELSPGEALALNATIRTPNIPGKYKLILTMVQEAVAWFNDKTPNYPAIDIEVVSP
jgi:hypothetical protein